ncbi:MAG: LacI family transcriptional regulator [Clostridiales bacterium]|nr:LacI family transcriptional regulator [Clostridiales bacterium]
MSAANINDVAKAAGVSLATVSRVVRGQDCVRRDTREKVLRAIDDLNYTPNALARQLRTQETKIVIVIVPDIKNAFFHEILFGIETEATKNGYQVLIADMHNEPTIEKHYFHAIQQRQVDGIISLSSNIAYELIEQVAEESPIIVACQYLKDSSVPNITIDNVAAAKTAVDHLLNMGHRNIAFLGGPMDSLLYQDRYQGYLSALKSRNLPVNPHLIADTEPSIMGGYDGMESLLALEPSVSAVFAAGDTMAIGAIKALKSSGRRVPEDCAVVGFDDIELSSIWEPTLTTIRQPKYQIGTQSFLKLLKLMRKEPLLHTQSVLPFELVIRESCGYRLFNPDK